MATRLAVAATAVAATVILAGTALAGQQGPPTPSQMAGKTAGQYYKNIKVLNDVPADKLFDGMDYMTIALGVRCEFCHENRDFASDAKRPKNTAREMMQMLFSIQKEDFHGRPAVSCYTCHQGHQRPDGMPQPTEAAEAQPAAGLVMPQAKPMQPAAGTAIPTLEQILAKYADALGGQQALAQVKTRLLDVERGGGNRPPVEEQVYEGASNKVLIVTHFGPRTFRTGYNGTEVWQGGPRGGREVTGMQALLPPREGQLNPAAAITNYQGLRLVEMAQIGDDQAYVLMGRAPDGTFERLYFDTKSGLLLRRTFMYRTIFGPLLYEADYSDYQKQDGVAIPYKTTWWAGGFGWTDTVKSVQTNVPVKDSEFEPPAAAPGPEGGGAQ